MICPPFYRVLGIISGSRMSQFRPLGGLDRLLESIPPKIHIFQPCSRNLSTITEPFPTIPTALQSPRLDLSNDVWYDPILQGDYRGRAGKQKHGKFQFSSPRVGIEAWIPPLESPELSGFNEMSSTRFGSLLKIQNSSSTSIQFHQYSFWVLYVEWYAKCDRVMVICSDPWN